MYRIAASRHKRFPPGPRGFEALWSTIKASQKGTLHKQAKAWCAQYGELVLCRAVVGDFCFLNSARLVREAFTSKDLEPLTNDRPPTFAGWFHFYNYSDIATQGPSIKNWSKLRKLFHHSIKFYGDGVEKFESMAQTQLQRLADIIETSAGEEMDMEDLVAYFLLSILSLMLIGQCPEEGSDIFRLMTDYNHANNEVLSPNIDALLTVFPFLRFIPGTYSREMCLRANSKRDLLLGPLFTDVRKTHIPGKQRGIVDFLLDEQMKAENSWLTDDNIRAVILNTTAGGFSTSLQTLKSLFFYLLHNPRVTAKIQREIEDKIGQRLPTVEDRNSLPYSEAVILETLRCSSIVALGLPHIAMEDIRLDGYDVPKGSKLVTNTWTFHRDPEVWGDPDVFRPERFLDAVTGDLLPATNPIRQSLLPFGIGKRGCPAENFAKTRTFLFLTTILQRFDIHPPEKHELPPMTLNAWADSTLILHLKRYWITFRRRH